MNKAEQERIETETSMKLGKMLCWNKEQIKEFFEYNLISISTITKLKQKPKFYEGKPPKLKNKNITVEEAINLIEIMKQNQKRLKHIILKEDYLNESTFLIVSYWNELPKILNVNIIDYMLGLYEVTGMLNITDRLIDLSNKKTKIVLNDRSMKEIIIYLSGFLAGFHHINKKEIGNLLYDKEKEIEIKNEEIEIKNEEIEIKNKEIEIITHTAELMYNEFKELQTQISTNNIDIETIIKKQLEPILVKLSMNEYVVYKKNKYLKIIGGNISPIYTKYKHQFGDNKRHFIRTFYNYMRTKLKLEPDQFKIGSFEKYI